MHVALIVFCLFFFIGCNQINNVHMSEEIITISSDNVAPVDLSEYLSDIHFVALETNDTCILNRYIDLKVSDNKLYVSSGKSLFIFDNDGRLLSKFKHSGRGPFEYVDISDFQVFDNKYITVLDKARRQLITYDFQGGYIESYKIDCVPRKFAFLNDTMLVVAADYYKPDDMFHFYDRRRMTKIKSCHPLHEQKLNYLKILDQHNFSSQYGRLLYTEALSSRILDIAPDSIRCKYEVINSRFPSDDFYRTPFEDVRQFMEEFKAKRYVALGGNLSYGENYFFFSYCGYPDARYCFYDIKRSNSNNFKTIKLSSENVLSDFNIIPLNDGWVAIIIPASELSGKIFGDTSFQNLHEADNPVIYLGRIK